MNTWGGGLATKGRKDASERTTTQPTQQTHTCAPARPQRETTHASSVSPILGNPELTATVGRVCLFFSSCYRARKLHSRCKPAIRLALCCSCFSLLPIFPASFPADNERAELEGCGLVVVGKKKRAGGVTEFVQRRCVIALSALAPDSESEHHAQSSLLQVLRVRRV